MTGRTVPRRIAVGVAGAVALLLVGGCDTLFDVSYPVPTSYSCSGDPVECSGAEFTPRAACADGCSQAYTCLVNDCPGPALSPACSSDTGCARFEWGEKPCLPLPTSSVQCAGIQNESPCLARPDCRWGLHCTGLLYPCEGIQDQATCQSTPTCFWHRDSG